MSTMRAIAIHQPGPDARLVLESMPIPVPAADEVRLRVAYAGLNRADIFQRQGNYPVPEGASPILGLEASGWIDALGNGVEHFTLGQEVCALLAGGGYADYVCVPAGQVMTLPEGWSLEQAACLPEAVLTVWLAVIATGGAKAGDTVLIQSGASGIGAVGIPLLKALGMRVIALARTEEKCAWCLAQGADAALPYDTPASALQQAAGTRGIAVVLDMLGGAYLATALKALAPQGRLVSLAFLNGTDISLPLGALLMKNLSWHGVTLRSQPIERKAQLLQEATRALWPLWSGRTGWRPAIDQLYPLENAQKAQIRMEERLHLGKILLRVGA